MGRYFGSSRIGSGRTGTASVSSGIEAEVEDGRAFGVDEGDGPSRDTPPL